MGVKDFKLKFKHWNARRWHFPDVYEHRGFKIAAKIITHVGFFAKAILYGSMGVVAMLAASQSGYSAEGPENVIANLRTTFGLVITLILTIGLFSYSCFAIFYAVFDIDRLGHHGAMPILSRFGRLFSAGFYAFLGVVAAQTTADIHQNNSLSSELGRQLFSTTPGKAVIVFLGVVFIVVALVYINYALRPAQKFYRELASERMNKYMFYTFITIARIGACGRILFFGAFGVVLIDIVANNQGTDVGNTTVIGLEGVLLKIGSFSHKLLFITGGLLFMYAIWAFILCIFRRLPAHYSAEAALHALGTRWRVRRVEYQNKRLARHGIEAPITGRINLPPTSIPLEVAEEGRAKEISEMPVAPQPTAGPVGTPAQ